MKDKDIDQRHAAAYHVAGQAVMAFYLGGWVNDKGARLMSGGTAAMLSFGARCSGEGTLPAAVRSCGLARRAPVA